MSDVGFPFRINFGSLLGGKKAAPQQPGFGTLTNYARWKAAQTPVTPATPTVQLPATVGGSSGPKRRAKPKTKRQRRQELEAVQRDLDKFKSEIQRTIEAEQAKRGKKTPRAPKPMPRGRADLGLTPGMDMVNAAAEQWAWGFQQRAIEQRARKGPPTRQGPRGQTATAMPTGPKPTLDATLKPAPSMEEILRGIPGPVIGRSDPQPRRAPAPAGTPGGQPLPTPSAAPSRQRTPSPSRSPRPVVSIPAAIDVLATVVSRARTGTPRTGQIAGFLAPYAGFPALGVAALPSTAPSRLGSPSSKPSSTRSGKCCNVCKPKKKPEKKRRKARTECSVYEVRQLRIGTRRKFLRNVNC